MRDEDECCGAAPTSRCGQSQAHSSSLDPRPCFYAIIAPSLEGISHVITYYPLIVLGGESAVPCTRNPQYAGRNPLLSVRSLFGSTTEGGVDGRAPRIGKRANRVRAGRQQH